jgi:hypothetical protein
MRAEGYMREGVIWQRCEGAAVLIAGIAMFAALDPGLAVGWAVLLFFAPDLSFAAYLAGPKAGAVVYNLMHVYALGAGLLAAGLLSGVPLVAGLGALWLAHSGFDRMLGYGLKLSAGFKETHLGTL